MCSEGCTMKTRFANDCLDFFVFRLVREYVTHIHTYHCLLKCNMYKCNIQLNEENYDDNLEIEIIYPKRCNNL